MEKIGWDHVYEWQKILLKEKVLVQGIITRDAWEFMKSYAPRNIKELIAKRPLSCKVIDEALFPFSIILNLIYPDKLVFIVPQENLSIFIEDKYIYKTLEIFFKLLYGQGKAWDKNELLK
jgi:hypothetical protein